MIHPFQLLRQSLPVNYHILVRTRTLFKTSKNPDTGTYSETLVPVSNVNNPLLNSIPMQAKLPTCIIFMLLKTAAGSPIYDINFYAIESNLKIRVYSKLVY